MDDVTKDVTKNEEVQEEQAKEVIQKKPEEQLDGELKADEKYSIYHFITENSSILGMVGSVCIAIVAACLRLASYLHHLAYLRYWNIDTSLVAEPENYWFEKIGLSLLLVVTTIIFTVFAESIYSKKKSVKIYLKRKIQKNKQKMKSEIINQKGKVQELKDLEEKRYEHALDYYASQKVTVQSC